MTTATARAILAIANSFPCVTAGTARFRDWHRRPAGHSGSRRAVVASPTRRPTRSRSLVPPLRRLAAAHPRPDRAPLGEEAEVWVSQAVSQERAAAEAEGRNRNRARPSTADSAQRNLEA